MKTLKSNAVAGSVATVTLSMLSSPAFAQFTKATTALTQVQTWLLSIAGVIFTICCMFVGFKMMAQSAQWKDVAPVFWGGCLVAGAAGLGSLFF